MASARHAHRRPHVRPAARPTEVPGASPVRAAPRRPRPSVFAQRHQMFAARTRYAALGAARDVAGVAIVAGRAGLQTVDAPRRVGSALARVFALPTAGQGAGEREPSLRRLALLLLALELCAVGLLVVAPLGGMAQTVSPLARAWPWLLWPAHLVFPNSPLHIRFGQEHNLPPWPTFIFTGLLLVASVIAGAATLQCLRAQRSTWRHLVLVLGGAALVGGTLVLLPSMPSDDIFSYVMYGRISALHHANPLLAMPAQFSGDPFLSFVYWRDVRSVYGSVWLLTSSGVTHLAEALGGALATYVLLFKLLGLVCHLINATLIWLILGRVAPARRLMGTLLYAWSPLCLLEFGASGHNDALMAAFLLLSVYLLVRRWEVLALVAFGLSVATKYVPVALLLVYLYAVARQVTAGRAALREGGRRPQGILSLVSRWVDVEALWAGLPAMAWRAAIVGGVVAITMLPYWGGPQTLNALLSSPPAERLTNSWADGISVPLQWLAQAPFGLTPTAAFDVVGAALKVIALAAFAVLWLREFRRADGLMGTLEAWAWVLLWYVCVASGWFWPWYVTWVIVVVALLPWSDLSMATLLLAGGVLIIYLYKPLNGDVTYGYRSLLAFGPALGYLLGRALMRRYALRHGVAAGVVIPERATPPLASTGLSRG
jgi:hypothetical protein